MVLYRFTKPTKQAKKATRAVAKKINRRKTLAMLARNRRRRGRRNNGSTKPRFVLYNQLVQQSVITKLKLVETQQIDPASGVANQIYRLNSIYESSLADTSHRPSFYTQWSNLYNGYRVLGCRYRIKFESMMTGDDVDSQLRTHASGESTYTYPYILHRPQRDEHICFVELNDQNANWHFTESTDLDTLRETGARQDNVQWCYKTSTKNGYISGYNDCKSLLSDRNKYFQAVAISANPSTGVADGGQSLYLRCGAMTPHTASDTNSVRMTVTLEYTVMLSDPTDNN